VNATIRIKGYERVEQIAQGRHAVVFRAYDSERHRAVVFKVLLPHLVEDPRFLSRFKRAVQVATAVEHGNLVNVLLYGRADLSYFVAYEHYHGVSLDKILSDHPRFPLDVALQILAGLSAGLEACHLRHLVHRDVRPGNIILTRSGGVKLDNLALASDVGENGRLAFVGRVSTTASYMSPEQVMGEDLGPQSDVFSLGAVAWELLCGTSAFGCGTIAAVAERIRTAAVKRVSEVNPMVEQRVCDIIQRMLEKDRTRRYPSAAEVAADLKEAVRAAGCQPDARAVARFVENPAAYMESQTAQTIAALKAKIEAAGSANPALLVGYYETLAYLEPGNQEYPRKIEQFRLLARQARNNRPASGGTDAETGVTYRVILESLDTARETSETFAAKLAEKLQVPVAAVEPFVDRMPSAFPGAHPHRKALYVAKMLEDLGAVTRIEACRAEPARTACPQCGARTDPNEEYCPSCRHRFLPVVELRPGLDETDLEPCPEGHKHGGTSDFVKRFLRPVGKTRG
jgi:serine/threonine-protein kinase